MIDLHTHSNHSDGSLSPRELIEEAVRAGVEVLSITDHDSFAGYDRAVPIARAAGVELLCGIELSTKLDGRSVHLLGYFPVAPGDGFRAWVSELQITRRERNVRLAARLHELGFDIRVEEAEALGRGMTGRPHFAKVMLDKGYVKNLRHAFDEYLDESAKAYVHRLEPSLEEGVKRIREAGGIASVAHPSRLHGRLEDVLERMRPLGLEALEAYHSDHEPGQTSQYLQLAQRYGMKVTGGSDYHGAMKPEVRLGTGHNNNLAIPRAVADALLAHSTRT